MMQLCRACLCAGLLLSCHPLLLQLCEPQNCINVKCSSDPPMTTPSSLTSTHSHVQRPSRRAHRQLRRWVAAAAGGRAGRPAAAPPPITLCHVATSAQPLLFKLSGAPRWLQPGTRLSYIYFYICYVSYHLCFILE